MSIFGRIFKGASSFGGDDIDWYCDSCNTSLNAQSGFNNDSGEWNCTECGYQNDVTSNNVYESKEEYRNTMDTSSSGKACESCDQSIAGGVYTQPWEDGSNSFGYVECPHCYHHNYVEMD